MRPGKGEGLNVETLAGESREAFRTSDLDNRLQRYGSAKENALKFRRYLVDQREDKLAEAMGDCGNYMTLRDYFTIGQTRLAKICTCKKHLICPLCAIRRGAKSIRVNMAKVDELLKADPLLRQWLVTFTVKNGPDLGERFQHLTSCLRAYHKRRKGSRQKGEVLKASAAVWSYEFTNSGNGWHPHVHAIWLSREKPDMYRLRDEWKAITGDSFMCDVRPMDEADPVGAFLEVFKYALKFADLADPDRLHAYKTLKGKRLQGSFGNLRGLDVEPSDSDELLDDLPYIERMFSFVSGVGYVETGTTGEVKTHAA
jgi:plasmid rolling circle replication initiator protein Rep